MSTTHDLVAALKAELKAAGLTYADLAQQLGMAESSIKRIFAKGDMPLSRIDEVLRVLKMDFADLARKIADAQPLRRELTHEQEAAVQLGHDARHLEPMRPSARGRCAQIMPRAR
jgi:transcriptional regulator with XRE-family HTH domain